MSSNYAALLFLCVLLGCRRPAPIPSLAMADGIGAAAEQLRQSANADATIHQDLDVRGQSIVAIIPPRGDVRNVMPVAAPPVLAKMLEDLSHELSGRTIVAVVYSKGSSVSVELERQGVRVARPLVGLVPAGARVAVGLRKAEDGVVEVVSLHHVEE